MIAGKYRVERTLGAGGMGLVLAATHVELDQLVALKVLLPNAVADPVFVARFSREGKLAAKIASEHAARVLDVGRAEDGTPFLVMEYLDGQDLMAVARARGKLPIDEAIEYLVQACDAVAVAHSMGIIHRDLKPANLFLTHHRDGSPCVKVLDFGISKLIGGTGDGLTTGMLGSPIYMSPEQMLSSRDVDERSDIWSLGAILFRLLAAKPPYDAENVVQLALILAKESPESLREARPDVPDALEAVVLKCLAHNREDRFPSVPALAVALRPFASARTAVLVDRIAKGMKPWETPAPASTEGVPSPTGLEVQVGTLASQTTDASLPLRSHRWTWLVALAVVVIAGIGGGALFRARTRGAGAVVPEPAPQTSASIETSTAAPLATPAPPEPSSPAPSASIAPLPATSAVSITGRKPTPRPRGERPARGADAGGDSWGWSR